MAASGAFRNATARVYKNTYLQNPAHMSAYILNRPATSTVQKGVTNPSASVTLVTNAYDNLGTGCNATILAATETPGQHDSAMYTTGYTTRGNIRSVITPGDPTGSDKVWTVDSARRLAEYKERETGGVVLLQRNFGWTTSGSGQPYISETTERLMPAKANSVWGRSTQVLDLYGNVTESRKYEYVPAGGAFNDATARVYKNTYLQNPAHMSAYILNRLATSTVQRE